MRFLYPCDPFEKKKPDEAYEEEFIAAQTAELACSLYSAEDFDGGEFKPRPSFAEGEAVVYRGWMLKPDDYAELHAAIEVKGGVPLTSITQYRHCHYLPEWYHVCEDVTPKTIFLKRDDDFPSILAEKGWSAYFVKDYVKSLTTSRGSVAKSVDEIAEIVALIEQYRGQVEGGVCVREYEELRNESEERYFVFKQRAFSRDGLIPDIVEEIAARIKSPFFSIDVVLNSAGAPRLIELGDGQVSDRKKWSADRFVSMFADAKS
jgi:ATP-grasp domain, R2K clade family 3